MQVPRGRNNRLGRVGTIRAYDWSQIPPIAPLTNEPYMLAQPTNAAGQQSTAPPTSASWAATIIQRQSDQRESTPGTLTYTPAPAPQPNTVARWNSWAGPCLPNGQPAAPTSAASPNAASGMPGFFWVAIALGAAASAAYLLNDLME